MANERIWLIEDDGSWRAHYRDLLQAHGYHVKDFANGESALKELTEARARPNLVLLDLKLENEPLDGFAILHRLREQFNQTELPVVIITASLADDDLVQTFELGANDFIQKSVNDKVLLVRVEKEFATRRREVELEIYRRAAGGDRPWLIGAAPAWQAVLAQIEQLAPQDVSLCLRGERGTGKQQLAQLIHQRSGRPGLFLKLDCPAIPDSLFESELFGHEKHAFTNATTASPGKFRAADGGSLFLDEIGELPEPQQAKLLNVLEDREVSPIGHHGLPYKIDVRIISATNKDLDQAIERKEFRADLADRLGARREFAIFLPTLRDRAGDIRLLAEAHVKFFANHQRKEVALSDAAVAILEQYAWPGNVRELYNVFARVVAAKPDHSTIKPDDLPASIRNPPVPAPPAPTNSLVAHTLPELDARHEEAARTLIEAALEASGRQVEGEKGAAARLGINKSTLRSRMQKLGISRTGVAAAPKPAAKRPRRSAKAGDTPSSRKAAVKKQPSKAKTSKTTPAAREKSRKPREVTADARRTSRKKKSTSAPQE